ncbi:D-inositol-3-phosphate glycosyltransferase [Paraconexibacter sp. AEG42_29]|uniref:D-inositol-3-phosphate glycosyltransferase n=1 Tax=Paraconexibacter sp. AEG42_29 TaxID=2997339 RepID=A0AAU7B230_9ACTN
MSMQDPRPVLFVTNLVAPDRVGAFAALHARTRVELALFGGRSHHATGAVADPGVPHRHVTQTEVRALAASGDYRAVVCGTAGRTALPAAFSGARTAGIPFVLWSALWGQLQSPAHLAAWPLMRLVYRQAAHVVTYGEHVSAFARSQGARRTTVAPQAVDNAFWAADGPFPPPQPIVSAVERPFVAMFAGRPTREKGVQVLLDAWRASRLGSAPTALVLAGVTPDFISVDAGGAVHAVGHLDPESLRNFLHHSDVLVIPSVPTRSFREPWGLIANEAMNQRLPIIASDAVGAAAGGLVRDGRNGLVVPAGDVAALSGALTRLQQDPDLRTTLGAQAARDVAPFTHAAWADAFAAALDDAGSPTPMKEC